jgi:hypothetical protein
MYANTKFYLAYIYVLLLCQCRAVDLTSHMVPMRYKKTKDKATTATETKKTETPKPTSGAGARS